MPKLRRMFSSVSAPFCWPTKTMGRPSRRGQPAAKAGGAPARGGRRRGAPPAGRRGGAARGGGGRPATAGLTPAAPGKEAQRVEAAQAGDAVARRGPGADALLRRAQVPEQQREAIAQLVARHDLVHEAVLEEELGALEAGRQRFGDRAGGNAGPGKADERVRLGHGAVARGGGRGEDAGRGRGGRGAAGGGA